MVAVWSAVISRSTAWEKFLKASSYLIQKEQGEVNPSFLVRLQRRWWRCTGGAVKKTQYQDNSFEPLLPQGQSQTLAGWLFFQRIVNLIFFHLAPEGGFIDIQVGGSLCPVTIKAM